MRAVLIVGALGLVFVAVPARAQRLTDRDVTSPYTVSSSSATVLPRAARQHVRGPILLIVGFAVALTGGILILSGSRCRPAGLFGCFGAELDVAIGEVIAGVGGLLVLIGALLLAADASPPSPTVAVTGGPGDFGIGLRAML